ncbi:hypothetical protein [Flavobacterium sp.]|uniref:hypothetical protein n=1 Tax=Flavobacterium sp. TaxID=239 RepID=UPI00404887E3
MRIIFVFLFFYLSSYSQQLKGTVKDSSNTPIPFANIQILEKSTSKSAFFSKTDENGVFSIDCKNVEFPTVLKITHLSYEKKELVINDHSYIKVVLNEKTTTLKDVIIEQNTFDIVEKNDTLKYNLKKILNGSEFKLKDVIEKLPGLSIDESGKIRYNGKKIDYLLLDGDDFYNDQHQLATENLTPEMIEKIELLKNYQDLSSIKGFESSGATALNIGLNEKFKNIFKGTVEVEGGYKEKYRLNANTFNFGKILKYNIIANTNNINNNIFTINDFLDIKKILGQKIFSDTNSSSEIINDEDLPQFLFSKDLIKNKTVNNYTLNISNKKKAKQLDFFSVINNVNQTEYKNTKQLFFDNSPFVLRGEHIGGASTYSANVLKFENKINEKKYFSFNSYLILNKDTQNSNINNLISETEENNNFNNDVTNKYLKLGYNSKYKVKHSEKLLFEVTLINDYVFSKNRLNIMSSVPLIQFDVNSNSLVQKSEFNSFTFGIKGNAVIKVNKKNSFSVGLKSIIYNEKLQNKITPQDLLKFETKIQTTENTAFLKYNKKINAFFKYSVGLNFISNKTDLLNGELFFILPSMDLNVMLKKDLTFNISLNSTKTDYSIYQLTKSKIIKDYRTLLLPSTLTIEKNTSNNFQFNTTYTKPSSNFFSILNISYNNTPQSINKAFQNNSVLTQEKYSFTDLNNSLYLFFIGEKKFKKIPLAINIELLSTSFEKITSINNIPNVNKSSQNLINFEAKSYFKKNNFNISTGIEYLTNKNINITNTITNEYKQYSPYIKLLGQIFNENLYWQTKLTIHNFEMTSTSVNNIYDFGFLLKYIVKEKNYSIFLSGNNIFNISDNNTKNTSNYDQLFSEETIISSFSGFINLGISFSF